MKVHVFGCPGCYSTWSVPEPNLKGGEPREECAECGGTLNHEEVEV